MGHIGKESDITRATKYGEPVNPYNTNLSADIEELSPERLSELKGRLEKMRPFVIKRKMTPKKGLLNLKKTKIQS